MNNTLLKALSHLACALELIDRNPNSSLNELKPPLKKLQNQVSELLERSLGLEVQ
jgi:hypothetical protein